MENGMKKKIEDDITSEVHSETKQEKYEKIRKKVFDILQIGHHKDVLSKTCDAIIVFLIIVNIIISICFTFEELQAYYPLFHTIEEITAICFTIELLLRLWTADLLFGQRKFISIVKYLLSFNGIVEFWSIAPFYLPMLFPKGLVAFRMFRVIRILRLFQANTYSDAMSTIFVVIKRKSSQILSSMVMIFVIMIMASLVLYGFEHVAQPQVFTNAFDGLWWSTSALLTVGYGDIYPITIWGKAMGILITFLGVGMIAIPTGILSAGFTEYEAEQKAELLRRQRAHHKKRRGLEFCPFCGEKLPK